MKRNRPSNLILDSGRESLISSAGAVLLTRTGVVVGLERDLSRALSCWRAPRATHDPGKVLLDVATVVALGEPREGAQVAELTAWMPTPTRNRMRPGPPNWPSGMRVIARRERPHPGAQLHLTDANGWRITCLATNTKGPGWTLPVLEVRHRQRARCEDRIRALKDTGLRNLPFQDYAKNRLWLEIVALAADLLAWTQTRAFDAEEPARRWEPKRLRFRILAVAG